MKILYVEDEIPHVELTQRTLEDNLEQSFVLLHRESYQDALKLLDEETGIDIVLTDLRLPDGSGLDLLKKIRAMGVPPAVVLVTGQGDEQVAVAALKAGAADYLVKRTDYLHRLPVVITNAVAQNKLAREQAEKHEAQVRYQSLIEHIPAVAFLDETDKAETPIYISPRIESLTGYSSHEWIQTPELWKNNIHPEDRERVIESVKITHDNNERFQEEYRFLRQDGQMIWIKEDTNLLRDEAGNPLYWQGIFIDITQEKETAAALERQLKELTILNAVTLAGAEGSSEDEIIERVVNLTSLVYSEVCGVLLLNEQGNILTPHPSYFGANVEDWKNGTPISEGVTGKCVSAGKPIRLGDVTVEPVFIEIATGVRSELCVPISVDKRVIGVFNVESKRLNTFDNEDEQFLTTVAGSVGTALERLRLFNQEQQRNKELNALYQSTKSLTQSLEPDLIAASLLTIMDDLLGYEFASIYILDEQDKVLVPLAVSPKAKNLDIYEAEMEMLHTRKRPLGQGIIGWVAEHGQPIRSGDVSKDERYLPVIKNIKSELCVPLIARDSVIGAINIETTQLNAYSKGDENLLTALANQAAIAIGNAKLYQSALQASERRAVLHSISQDVVRFTQDIEQIYESIHEAAKKLMPCDVFRIALRNESTNENNFVYTLENGVQYNLPNEPANMGLTGKVVQTGKGVILRTEEETGAYPRFGSDTHVQSAVAVPMRIGDKVIGMISAQSYEPNSYETEEKYLLEMLATHAATAVENVRLFQEEKQRTHIIETLVDIANEIATTQDIIPVLNQITQRALGLLNANHVAIYLLHDDNDTLKVISAQGLHRQELLSQTMKVGEGITGSVVANGKSEIIDLVARDQRRVHLVGTPKSDADNETMMSAPLILRGKCIGAFNVWRLRTNGVFNPVELSFLTSIANQTSVAIESSNLFKETVRRAQEAKAIAEVGRDISATLQLDVVLTRIATYAMDLLQGESSAVYLPDLTKPVLTAIVAQGIDAMDIIKDPVEMGSGIIGSIAQNKVGEIVNDTINDPRAIIIEGTSSNPLEHIIGVPFLEKDQLTGMVVVWRSGLENEFKPSDLNFLDNLAQQAATAIKNARLYNEAQNRLEEVEAINRISSAMRATQSQSEMCDILLRETLDVLDEENGSVWTYESSANMIMQRSAQGTATKVRHSQLKFGDGIVGYVLSTGKVYISSDIKNDPLLFDGNREIALDGFGLAGIPIHSTDGILGVLMVQIESGRRVEDHVRLLATLAEIAGNAIHRADLFDQSQDQVLKLTTLRDIDSAIASSTDLRVTLNILMDHTIKHLKIDAVDILLYHAELQSLSLLCSSGFKTPSPSRPLMRVGEGLAGKVVMKGQVVQIPDLRETTEATHNPMLTREGFVSYIGVPLIVKGQIKGLFEIFHRSELSPNHEWKEFMYTLTGQAAIAIDNSQLFDNLQRSNQEIRQAYDTTLEGWARALELRDRETEGHTRRVTELTMRLAHFMNINDEDLVNINRGVLLHDIGKMGVPDHILRKTGSLTDTEWVEMRQHPQYAYDLLSPILYLRPALDIPYCHHEHWDGSGYPRGLKGAQIPLSARIFSVVDIWDALLSDRPYRNAWPREKVIEYLKEISGSILDPKIVAAFLDMLNEEESKMG